MSRADSGSAFPVTGMQTRNGQPIEQIYERGMTLRDYFAAQALTTCLGYEKDDIKCWVPVDFARHAYQVADAMLLERAK